MKRAEIDFINPSLALVRGWGTREALTDLKGRPPVYARRERAWVAQPKTARDLIVLLEQDGYEVTLTGTPAARSSSSGSSSGTTVPVDEVAPIGATSLDSNSADEGVGLW